MRSKDKQAQLSAFVECGQHTPLGLHDVHLSLQLDGTTPQWWHIFWLHGGELGLKYTNSIEGDRVLADNKDAIVWIADDDLATALGAAIETATQWQHDVKKRFIVINDQVCQEQALGCLTQDQRL